MDGPFSSALSQVPSGNDSSLTDFVNFRPTSLLPHPHIHTRMFWTRSQTLSMLKLETRKVRNIGSSVMVTVLDTTVFHATMVASLCFYNSLRVLVDAPYSLGRGAHHVELVWDERQHFHSDMELKETWENWGMGFENVPMRKSSSAKFHCWAQWVEKRNIFSCLNPMNLKTIWWTRWKIFSFLSWLQVQENFSMDRHRPTEGL